MRPDARGNTWRVFAREKLAPIRHSDEVWLLERLKRIRRVIMGFYDELENGRILDVGVGGYSLIKYLFPKLYVTGLDRVSRAHKPDDFLLANVKWRLPFRDATFKMVFAGEIVEHLGLDFAYFLIAETFRVLQNSGYLLLTTPNGFRNMIKKVLRKSTVRVHKRELTFTELNRFLRQVGFSVKHSEGIQPLFIPWNWTERFVSLELHGSISSQLIFLCQK